MNPLSAFRWSGNGSGLDHLLGEPAFATEAEAERAWQRVRRDVWAREQVGRIPAAAQFYDGLTCATPDAAALAWECTAAAVYPHADVRAAIEQDRASLAAFVTTQPKAAKQMADVLDVLRAYLLHVEHASAALQHHRAAGLGVGPHPFHARFGTYRSAQLVAGVLMPEQPRTVGHEQDDFDGE